MRPLYPGAHHDRFIHSLGVYRLARIVLGHLTCPPESVSDSEWNTLTRSFEIACLMHDCGHAPFSHTCEHFYNYSDTENARRRAEHWLLSLVDEDFKKDIHGVPVAEHETFSAALLIDTYRDVVTKLGGDVYLAARMITGCRFASASEPFKQLANCFIELLNGTAIDLDKLDYIIRDTWASGVKNTAVDVDRLLSAVKIKPTRITYRVCFHKSALSVIRSVVDARNYLFEWIYNHHTVVYYAELLKAALLQLAKGFATDDNPDHFWEAVFSAHPFREPVELAQGVHIYLPADGDLMHLLKARSQKPEFAMVNELLSHNPSRIPLWKTYGEFKLMCDLNNINDMHNTEAARARIPVMLAKHCGNNHSKEDFVVIEAKSRTACIEANGIMVDMGEDEPVSYTEIYGKEVPQLRRFFYVFVPKAYSSRIDELRDEVCRVFV